MVYPIGFFLKLRPALDGLRNYNTCRVWQVETGGNLGIWYDFYTIFSTDAFIHQFYLRLMKSSFVPQRIRQSKPD